MAAFLWPVLQMPLTRLALVRRGESAEALVWGQPAPERLPPFLERLGLIAE